jgi:hypothetical protein
MKIDKFELIKYEQNIWIVNSFILNNGDHGYYVLYFNWEGIHIFSHIDGVDNI